MRRTARLIGTAVAVCATVLSIYLIARSWEGQDLTAYATPGAAAGIVLATVFYVLGAGLSALAWRELLLGVGLRRRWTELCGIVSATQIGKYLPGNFAHHLGRGALAMDRGIGPVHMVSTGLAEIALLCIASAMVGGFALLASGRLQVLGGVEQLHVAGLAVLVAGLSIAGLIILNRAVPRLLRRFAPALVAGSAVVAPTLAANGRALCLYAVVYLVFGAGFVAMTALVLPDEISHGWLLVAAFALAWILGFATPGAPAGVGVREAVMLVVLSDAYAPADASAIVLALRVATTMGDLVLLPLGLWQLRRTRPRVSATAEDPTP